MPKPISPKDAVPTPSTEVRVPRKRRVFTGAHKARIVSEAMQCSPEQLGALLRREGLYAVQLAAWKKVIEEKGVAGFDTIRRGRKPGSAPSLNRVALLEQENRKLQRELALSRKLIELQKKVSELLSIPLSSEMS